MRRERFVNNASSTLNGGIDNSTTTVTVVDGSVFPTEGDYRIRVSDSEVMLVTARSGNNLTVVRGIEGSSATSHSDAAECIAILTAGGLVEFIDQARPPADYPYRLSTTSFTGVNMGTASVANDPWGGITLTDPQTTGGNRLQVRSAPSTPYVITANLLMGAGAHYGTAGTHFGLIFRDSVTGEFIENYYELGDHSHVAKWDNPTTFNSFLAGEASVATEYDEVWVQIEDDGTDLFFRQSRDGVNWFTVGSEGRTAFLNPDEVGWMLSSRGSAGKMLSLRAWVEE